MSKVSDCVISCSRLSKFYKQGSTKLAVLSDINLRVGMGERIAIVGTSGSGKTTLLNLLGGLDLPSSGTVTVAGKNLNEINESDRGFLRNKYLGFVFQFHHLLGEFTALENVTMPLLISGSDAREAEGRSRSSTAGNNETRRYSFLMLSETRNEETTKYWFSYGSSTA